MADQTQEVRTVWSWDTTNVEMATKRIEQSFAREEAARKKAQASAAADEKKPGGGAHGGGHGGTSNAGMGVHDFLMGRQAAAMFRFGNAAKLAAGYASGFAVALELGGKASSYVRAEIEKTDTAAARLEQSFLKVSKAATFSTVGEGSGKLNGTRDSLMEQIQGERAQQGDLRDLQLLQNQKFGGDPLGGNGPTLSAGGWYYKAKDRLSSYFTGSETVDQKMAGSQLRERAAGQELAKINGQITGAYGLDRDIAREKGVGGDPFAAQRLDVTRREGVEMADARSHGSGTPENLALIKEKYDTERKSIDQADKAAGRQIESETKLLSIKARGGAVEVESAKERLQLAGKALQAQPFYTKEYYRALNEQTKAQQDVALAGRNQQTERASYRFDLTTAGFRGNSDDRAARSAQTEVEKAKEKLRILQETKGVKATEQELNEANLALVSAETSKEMLRRQQLEARLQLESTVRMAPGAVRAAGALLTGASTEGAQREALVQQARAAQEALAVATKRAEIEKGSVESIKAQVEAQRELAQSQIAVALHDQQVRRARRYEMQGAQGETASLRFAASGRDDLAELAGQRSQSHIAIEHANQDGKPRLAAELAEQQRLREQRTVGDMYLNPDGTRRRTTDVQGELRQRRLRQSRVDAFNLQHPGGLSDVHRDSHGNVESAVDMLTGERINARQIAARNADAKAKIDTPTEQSSDAEVFKDIWKLLDTRLPQTTAK